MLNICSKKIIKNKKGGGGRSVFAPLADLCSIAPWHSSGSWRSILARQTLEGTSRREMAAPVTLCFSRAHEENIAIISDKLLLEVLVSLEILAVQQAPVRKTIIITSEKTSKRWYGRDCVSSINLANVDLCWPDRVLQSETLWYHVRLLITF